MAPSLDQDVLYIVIREIASLRRKENLEALCCLSITSQSLRQACLPVLFAEVHWPHANKHDEVEGLHFFPDSLLAHIRFLRLSWPDHWPDASPPLWGDKYYIGGDYHPRHMDKLITALPKMTALSRFHISCPFFPPNSLFSALIHCPSVLDLSINDTPLYISMIPHIPPAFNLERLTIVPVAEALRVGEGPYDSKYHELSYYTREYRRKYKNDILSRYAASAFLFNMGKASLLRYVQVSGDLCTLDELAENEWPNLETFVLTGHPPRPQNHKNTEFVDIIAQMPRLKDLRLLFAKTKGDTGFRVVVPPPPSSASSSSAPRRNPLAQLKHLAISNACNLDFLFHHTHSLERLAIVAIINHPRVPIGLGRSEVERVLADLEEGGVVGLKRLRIMVEDKVNPELCHAIAMRFPALEWLEVEICGYHDGKSVFAWSEFAETLVPLTRLTSLRLCIQFPEFDETDRAEPWRAARRECATFLAERVGSLKRVGFEYRKRTGTHRYEDSWLEWDVERRGRGGAQVELFELMPSWYPFPEVWEPVPIPILE